MRRRTFMGLLGGAAAWPLIAHSQPARIHRVGVLANEEDSPPWRAFRQALHDLGYVEGRNLSIERRVAGGRVDRFPELATELVELKVDVIVTSGTIAAQVAKQATVQIPIVMTQSSYPDKLGLVESMARPAGNVTGLNSVAPELIGKRLELLKEIVPKIGRLAVLWDESSVIGQLGFKELSAAADVFGIKLESVDARTSAELSNAFASVSLSSPDALYVYGNHLNFKDRTLIAGFAADKKLPSSYEERLFVEAGGLVSPPSFIDLFRRAASYVDKILRGAKPADLPVELPTKFELYVNLKTAKAIGLTIPPTLLTRADAVIE